MAKEHAKQEHKESTIDTKSGSLAYNRLDMQVSQTLHMAIELYPNLNYLLVLDHYDDITCFDDDISPEIVSYYQMKTNEESISIDTAISLNWISRLYEKLDNPEWFIKELGLITNCPLKVSVKTKDTNGKSHSEEKKYTSERTPFLSFNPIMVNKIKNDIAIKKGISPLNVDLSKFYHMRTTLSISKHKEIVEQEMSNFLQDQYPRITVESVKTIYNSMLRFLTERQAYENLDKTASLNEVRQKKGISKSDFSRIIENSMYISVPAFSEISQWMGYTDEEKPNVALEYTNILSDLSQKSPSFSVIFQQIKRVFDQNAQGDGETIKTYCERIYDLLPNKSPIYSKTYVAILVASMIINKWRRSI